ncbi:MAG: PAS domain S-box protein [Anaerolineales bacterium]|nr:PAS domain S-box protein [Anaerolineales bacterium]
MTSELSGPALLAADVYLRAFQVSPNLMALSEVDTGRYVEVNEAFLGALGYQRAEVIGRTALELGIFAEPEQHAVVLGRPPAAGRLRDYAVRVRTKAGEVRASLFAAEPLQVGGQRLLLTIMSDITERHRTELERQAAAELYHSLLASLDSVVAVFDAAGQALYLNEVAARQLGGTPADFVGRRMSDLFPEPSASRQLADLQAVLAADQGRVAESEAVVQGRPRWYRTHLQPIHDAQGRAVQVLINTADITEFRAAQSELEQLNETLEQRVAHRTAEVQDLYENAPCGYHSLDAAGVIVRINQTELDWLGYTRAEVVGRLNFSHLLTPAGRAAFAETYPRLQQAGAIRDLEFELVRRDGSLLPVSLSATAIYDAQGRYLMDRAVLTDITAQRQAEAERRRRHEELSAANHALARAARLKNEFLSTMSHELRTPLNAILSLSESLEEGVYGPLNPAQVRALSHVAESGRHLLDLINDILDLSKIEAGKLEWVGGPVDVAELCQAALRLVRQLAAQKPLSLTFTQDSAVTILTGDARRLKQMLVNLLSNAVKFTPAGGEVGLEV